MIRAVIFDFDGVIAESVEVKSEAFRELFSGYPDKVGEIVRFHIENGGMSRFVKFRYIYKNILNEDLSDEMFDELCVKFNKLVIDKVVEAPYVKGAFEMLIFLHDKVPMYIVSGTPKDEMREIVARRQLKDYFVEVFGSPEGKTELITRILKDHNYQPGEVLFVGDSKNDYDAALDTGIIFIARSLDRGQEWVSSSYTKAVLTDLVGLKEYVDKNIY